MIDLILKYPIQTIVLLIVLFFGFKYSIWLFRYLVAVKWSKKLVYMKITMPRAETQKDKEKQVEKDFREVIGVMAQFYRNIHEIRELNLRNRIRTWIFDLDVVSFELVAQSKLVEFYVVTYPYYQGLIEKQITSYYPDADIQMTEPYDIYPKGHKMRSFYAYQAKPFHFPIQTYKKIENDPLNSLTNVLSKLEETDNQIKLNKEEIRLHVSLDKENKDLAEKNNKLSKSSDEFKKEILGLGKEKENCIEENKLLLEKKEKTQDELNKIQNKMLELLGREKRLNEYIPIVNNYLQKVGKPKIF